MALLGLSLFEQERIDSGAFSDIEALFSSYLTVFFFPRKFFQDPTDHL